MKKTFKIIVTFYILFSLLGLGALYFHWISMNKKAQTEILTEYMNKSIDPSLRFVMDSLHIPFHLPGGISNEKKKGFHTETEHYKAYIEYTDQHPMATEVEILWEDQESRRLEDRTFDLNLLARMLKTELKKEGIETSLGIKLRQDPSIYLRDTIHAQVHFSLPEKKDSIIASYCYTDSSTGFNYQKANLLSDTLGIGIRDEGELIAYASLPCYRAANKEMREKRTLIFIGFIAMQILVILSFTTWYFYRKKQAVITHTVTTVKEVVKTQVLEKEIIVEKPVYVIDKSTFPKQENFIIEYGNLRLDPQLNQLKCGEKTITLSHIPATILKAFFESTSHYISKEELIKMLWDENINEQILNDRLYTHIGICRKILKQFSVEIINIGKKGYKIIKS